jgi:hypothetical protein
VRRTPALWLDVAVKLLLLVVGFGGVTAILWELGEYFAFIRHSSELATLTRTRSAIACRPLYRGGASETLV